METGEGLELSASHQLLRCADYVNLLDKNINTRKETQRRPSVSPECRSGLIIIYNDC
jgi:hypothetical protein